MMDDSKISSDFLKGFTDTMILKLLIDSDKYGYDILRLIHQNSGNEYDLKEATMYSSLKRQELDGNIASYWGDESQGGRRRYYKITDKGRTVYQNNKNSWEYARRVLDKLL